MIVPTFKHDVSDYVQGGLLAGFNLTQMKEVRDDIPETIHDWPRLLILTWVKK